MQTFISRRPLCSLLLTGLTLGSMALRAQSVDETYNAKIKEYTTDKRFLPSSVLNLTDSFVKL